MAACHSKASSAFDSHEYRTILSQVALGSAALPEPGSVGRLSLERRRERVQRIPQSAKPDTLQQRAVVLS